MEFQIRLNSMEEVVRWVTRLEYHGCRADACLGDLVIDARSLMGLWGFGIGKTIRIVVHSELSESLHMELQEFVAS